MRTESLRRVYCDACGEHTEMWLPYAPEAVAANLRGRGWVVETWRESDRVHMHLTTPLVIGRVMCPACQERGAKPWQQ